VPPPTITPLPVAELLVEGERWPVCVHVIDHPDARVLVDMGMTELRPEVADMDPWLVARQLRVRALEPELVWLAHEHQPWRPPTV
jgi:hypothetical protein